MRVSVVDYGAGNLFSVCRALEAVGAVPVLAGRPEEVLSAERLVLPGVGAFDAAMASLRAAELVDPLRSVARRGTPFLGICLGMQVLLDRGTEGDGDSGLGLFEGTVIPLPPSVRVPHMGWQRLRTIGHPELLPEPIDVYFAHSFYVPGDHPDAIAVVDHGVTVAGALGRDNVLGVQFHPEKSGRSGLGLLARFLEV